MSSATPSRPTPASPDLYGLVTTCLERVAAGVRAVAFWAAALLPLLALASVVAGVAGQHPSTFAGVLALNAVCAVVGHNHSPDR